MLNGFQPPSVLLKCWMGSSDNGTGCSGKNRLLGYRSSPSGPMDALAFRIGNRLLGNEKATGLEMTLRGGTYRFRCDMQFCLTGADMSATLDGVPVPMYTPVTAGSGSILVLGEAAAGMRTYLLVAGGLDMPLTLGSASTFTLGGFGGHTGAGASYRCGTARSQRYWHSAWCAGHAVPSGIDSGMEHRGNSGTSLYRGISLCLPIWAADRDRMGGSL